MAAGNAFVNGFMGGMGAMNTMIDSKARREHMAWQKEMVMEDREIEAQERDYINQERQRVDRVRNLTGTMHVWQNMKPDAKKAVEKAWINQMNQNPAIAAALDNNNPNERAQLGGLSWAKDSKGNMMAIPMLDIYDVNDPKKKLRSGPMSQRRQDGGPVLGMPMNDFYDFATSQAGMDPLLAAQAEILRQGGTLPEVKDRYGELVKNSGRFFQQNETTGEWDDKGRAYDGTGGSGSGSGSGSDGGSWTKGKVIQKIDPTTNEPYDVQLYHQRQKDGSVRVQGMIHDAKGNTKIEDYGVKHFDQKGNLIQYGGLDAMGLNPNPTPDPGGEADGTGGGAQLREEDEGNPPKEKPEVKPKPKEKPIAEKIATSTRKTVGSHGYGAYQPSAETRERGLEPFKNYMKEQSKLRDELAEKKRIEEMEELIKIARSREKSRLGGML